MAMMSALASVPGGSLAQEVDGQLSFGYERLSRDDESANRVVAQAQGSLAPTESFSLGGLLQVGRLSNDDFEIAGFTSPGDREFDVDQVILGIEPTYALTPRFRAGVFLEYADVGGDAGDVSSTAYGIVGEGRVSEMAYVSGFFGRTDSDDFAEPIDSFGLRVDADLSQALSVFGSFENDEFANGTAERLSIGGSLDLPSVGTGIPGQIDLRYSRAAGLAEVGDDVGQLYLGYSIQLRGGSNYLFDGPKGAFRNLGLGF
ncbi:MAG: hypothetical protein AAFR35_06310 [Pseudomonadota bacterium]